VDSKSPNSVKACGFVKQMFIFKDNTYVETILYSQFYVVVVNCFL
jgi:hypothetical protein